MFDYGTGNFRAGLDLGSAADYSALVLVEHVLADGGAVDAYIIHNVTRWPLGTSFTEVLLETARLLDHPNLRHKVHLRYDRTGLGAPIGEMIRRMRLDREPDPGTKGEPFGPMEPAGIITTGGHKAKGYNIPKRDLVTKAEALLQQGLLTIPETLPLRKELEVELQAFQAKITQAGNDTYEGKREHDDIVLALAYALHGLGYERPVGLAPSRLILPDGTISPLEAAGEVVAFS